MKQGFFTTLAALLAAILTGCASPAPADPAPEASEVRKVAPNCDTLGGMPRCQWIEPPAPAKPSRVPGIEV